MRRYILHCCGGGKCVHRPPAHQFKLAAFNSTCWVSSIPVQPARVACTVWAQLHIPLNVFSHSQALDIDPKNVGALKSLTEVRRTASIIRLR